MAKTQFAKRSREQRRATRVRAKIAGTAARPRASVFRSLKHVYVQLIDDTTGRTIIGADDRALSAAQQKLRGVAQATAVGALVAERAAKLKITAVIFDRGPYKYHGQVKALADGMRAGGLTF
ncbi:MAG: 50S ribosomal protein L18 [Patescibacteria group bacterium]